jgi:hypothetical protein
VDGSRLRRSYCGPAFAVGMLLALITCADVDVERGVYARLELEVSYPEPFSYLSGVREMPDGRVLAADPVSQVLLSIDLESESADTLGGVGRGPNEYLQPDQVFPLPGDSTLLVDLGNGRFMVIAPDRSFTETRPLVSDQGPMLTLIPRFVDAEGGIYFQRNEWMGCARPEFDSDYVVRYDRRTGVLDTVAVLMLPEFVMSGSGCSLPPMTPLDDWAAGMDGTVAVVRASDYSVDWRRPDGTVVMGPPNPIEPFSVGEAEKERFVSEYGVDEIALLRTGSASGGMTLRFFRGVPGGLPERSIDDFEFPEVLPIFRHDRTMVSPEGHAWVERYMPAHSRPAFDVFDSDGVRLGAVQLPEQRRLIGFGDRTIYVVRIDEVDLKWLERYRVVYSAP